MTFQSNPLPSHQCLASGWAQIITCQLLPEAASAEPHSPPINAWLELEGNPNHQVSRFQKMAPRRAQIITSEVIETSLASMRPDDMVFATAVPQRAPRRL